MLSNISKFYECLHEKKNKMKKNKLTKVVDDYLFLYALEKKDLDDNQEVCRNIKESKIIIIDHYYDINQKNTDLYFIVGIKKTIIIINQSSSLILNTIFKNNDDLKICFMQDTKDIFELHVKLTFKFSTIKTNQYFGDEITSLNEYFCNINFRKKDLFNKIWKKILSCISGYLIQQGYLKLHEDRIVKYYSLKNKPLAIKTIKRDEYIELRTIDVGSSGLINLIYQIENEELLVIKKFLCNDETPKLLKRESKNYLEIKNPFVPKLYGKTEENEYQIIEFIDGETLLNINKMKLNEQEKLTIIFQLLSVCNYLHNQHFVYRDLKPNNIMVDRNKNMVLIDFDRMIKDDNNEKHTVDLGSIYLAPEIQLGSVSIKSDVYSIGKVIYFIIKEMDPINDELKNSEDLNEYPCIQKIYDQCTKKNPDERLSISDIFEYLYEYIIQKDIVLNHIDPENQYQLAKKFSNMKKNEIAFHYFLLASDQNHLGSHVSLALIYYYGNYIKQDINKALYYLSLAANQNFPEALFFLGYFFYENKYIEININKAIHYFTLAANLNDSKSQYYLGLIYDEGKFVSTNIKKSIYYYSLAANQNFIPAQFNLALIYLYGSGIERDVDKSIHYFSLAANQNDLEAQFYLGSIYYEGIYIKRDINKAMHYFNLVVNQNNPKYLNNIGGILYKCKYTKNDINIAIYYFTLAANQNYSKAQFNLGSIYYDGKYIARDINKSIYYFTLASNNNIPEASHNLGNIYKEGKYISRDIQKSIYYYTLAANQNFSIAQFDLGLLYYDGKYIPINIKKALHYLTLAANQNHTDAQLYLGNIYYENKYVPRDINKCIKYLTQASKQNRLEAYYNLGVIFDHGKYVPRDINKAIYYYTLSSKQNEYKSQCNLGLIYYRIHDIKKAIYYFTLAANQNDVTALTNLGCIYLEGKYVEQDIKKAIYYLKLASNLNDDSAQYVLGRIYHSNEYSMHDINKAIYYYSLASNQKNPYAQINLSSIYYQNKHIQKNLFIAIDLIMRSAEGGNIHANFLLGVLYHKGEYFKRNINISIKYYKNASSLNDEYAKNNLGIIYLNGFEKEINQNINVAKIYFNEAINKGNAISMYNLAHIYIYDEPSNDNINKSIKLLINSFSNSFSPSLNLLCIALIQKYGCNTNASNIKLEIENNNKIMPYVMQKMNLLSDKILYEKAYNEFKETDFLDDLFIGYFRSKDLYLSKPDQELKMDNWKMDINSDFYKGFGNDI